ncbi:MAG: trigger factor [Metamycoplasmataceae bacterium]
MTKKTIDNKTSEMRISVTIPKEDWKNSQSKAFETLAKNINIKGFRKGKVPLTKAKELIDQSQIWEKAILSLLDKYVVIASKEIKDDEIILDHPTYTVEKVTSDELEIIFVYPLFPEFKLKDYKKTGIILDKEDSEEKLKKDVLEQEKNLLSKTAVLLPKEGKDAKIEKGDTIVFDFKGFVNKKAFEGGEAEDFELKVGSGNFIPGFEEKMIGLKLGKNSIKVTFPKDYHVKELANKNSEFKLNIKEIKAFDLPELDEEFVKNLNIKDVKNKKDLRKYLLDLTKRENLEKARIKFKNEIFSRLLSQNEIPVPNTLMLKEVQMLSKKLDESLKKQGITKKEYLELTKMTNNDVTKELTVEAEKNIKTSLLFAHLAKIEKIVASEKDFEKQYERLAKVYNIEDVNMIKNMLPKEKIEPQITNDLVIDMLIKYNSK